MDCESARPKLSPYLDGELTGQSLKELRDHLDTCPDCSLHYEELKMVNDELREVCDTDETVSDSFVETFEPTSSPDGSLAKAGQLKAGRSSTQSTMKVLCATVSTLVLGCFLGTYLALGFLELSKNPSGVSQAASSQPLNRDRRLPPSAEVVSYTDAYVELANSTEATN